MLTKYEKARIIGARALQLFYGAPPLIKVKENADFVEIAEKELENKKIPLTIVQ